MDYSQGAIGMRRWRGSWRCRGHGSGSSVNSVTVGIERSAWNEYLEFWAVGTNSEAGSVFVLLLAHCNRSIWRHFNVDGQDVAEDPEGDLLFRGVQILKQLRDLEDAP